MDREFKFRAWETISKEMFYQVRCGGMFEGEATSPTVWGGNSWFNLIGGEFTKVMQYTGLKDKNEKEIYEGDIVKATLQGSMSEFPTEEDLQEEVYTGEVYFDNGYNVKTNSYCPSLTNYCMQSIEIIGNKYDNPELLAIQ